MTIPPIVSKRPPFASLPTGYPGDDYPVDDSWKETLGYAIPDDEPAELYPSSDGGPMAESDKHQQIMLHCVDVLTQYFRPFQNEVYVAGNNFLYYRPHTAIPDEKPFAVSPDVYVVFGIPQNPPRNSYKVWQEEGIYPSVIIEVTSEGTKDNDTGKKRILYEQTFKTQEYFLFDPTGDYLRPILQGYRLDAGGVYQRIPMVGGDRLYSEKLHLFLVARPDATLRFLNPLEGRFLPTLREAMEEAKEAAWRAETAEDRTVVAEERADKEVQARVEMEAQNTELLAEIAQLRALLAPNE